MKFYIEKYVEAKSITEAIKKEKLVEPHSIEEVDSENNYEVGFKRK
jgi:hypothetical protein